MSATRREVDVMRAYAAVVGTVGIVDWLRPNVERAIRTLDGTPNDIRAFSTWCDAVAYCTERGAVHFGLSSIAKSAAPTSIFQTPLQRAVRSKSSIAAGEVPTEEIPLPAPTLEFTEARVISKPWPRFIVQISTPSRGVFQTMHGQVKRNHRSVSGTYARSSALCIAALDRVTHIHQLRCPTKLLFEALRKRLKTWRTVDGCNRKGKPVPGYGLMCQLDDLIQARGLALQPPVADS